MIILKVRIETIRHLQLYEPTNLRPHDALEAPNQPKGVRGYGRQPFGSTTFQNYYHFPVIIDPEGAIWGNGSRYLLNKLRGVVPAKHRTLESLATDLRYFRQWVIDEEIDYLKSHARARSNPTYRFCAHLHDEISFQSIKPGTAKRRMSSVQNFYRWLQYQGTKFEHPLWIENDIFLNFLDTRGFNHRKTVKSTNLTRSFKNVRNTDEYSEYIDDGGKLRPLTKPEQMILIESLKKIGNTEMTLAFLIALTTGARLQTVFTLRRLNFKTPPRNGAVACRIKTGTGTHVSTKYGKQLVLLLPSWLYCKIQIYLKSPRYQTRNNKSTHVYDIDDEQYIFLTRAGRPYYASYSDPYSRLYQSPPKGNAITQFIRQQLKPHLLENDHNFEFRFHDLRATFGMNLLEGKLKAINYSNSLPENNPSFFQLLMYVKERMGHSQLRTTEAYLNYRNKYQIATNIQEQFEHHIQNLFEPEIPDNELD
ncbi:MAG: integrase [Candidatus Azotimanducaceae bacterium]